jgi:cytochrome c553
MMKSMNTHGTTTKRLVALVFVTVFIVGWAFGQTGEAVRAEVPHEFTFASKVVPAGTYTFTVTKLGLQMVSASGEMYRAPIMSWLAGPSQFLGDGALVFDKTGDSRVLSEVWIPGAEGILLHSVTKNHNHEVLLLSENLGQNRSLSGKAAYNQTCIRCHGPAGMGDKSADKFFKTPIPRLSSAEVQSKSDAELRELITQGGRAMAPVEIDEGGFRHRLPPESVDAVIAYVRTLKR